MEIGGIGMPSVLGSGTYQRARALDSDVYAKIQGSLSENVSEEKETGTETWVLMQFLREKSGEIFTKLQNGDTEPTFQIGASSFTEKEWEEFLGKFDSIEDAIRKLVEAEMERRDAAKEEEEVEMEQTADTEGLVSESTSCTCPSSGEEKEDVRYITWYTQEGIFCRQEGQTEGYFWSLEFDDPSQYQKVLGFLKRFPADANLSFAANEDFWKDFLAGEIEEADFVEFFNSADHGKVDYTYTKGDSMYIDQEKVRYAQYMNLIGNQLLTQTEMMEKQREIMEENAKKLKKLEVSDLQNQKVTRA